MSAERLLHNNAKLLHNRKGNQFPRRNARQQPPHAADISARNAKRRRSRNARLRRSHSARQLHNHNAKPRRNLKRVRQLRNVKRRLNVRQRHNRRNGRPHRNSTLRLRRTKTSTLISGVRQGIRLKIRGCRLNPRALAALPVNDRGKFARPSSASVPVRH